MRKDMFGLVIEQPTPKTPGFLKRLKTVARFQELAEKFNGGEITLSGVEELINIVYVAFVAGPEESEAKEIIENLSEEQFMELISAVNSSVETAEGED